MTRLMSFMLTTDQFNDRSKTVTRRLGWGNLEPGQILCGIEKGMGLKRGEKVNRLGHIRILSTRWERLDAITQEDVIKEGFPYMTPDDFVAFLCRKYKVKPDRLVNRIEFEHIEGDGT